MICALVLFWPISRVSEDVYSLSDGCEWTCGAAAPAHHEELPSSGNNTSHTFM